MSSAAVRVWAVRRKISPLCSRNLGKALLTYSVESVFYSAPAARNGVVLPVQREIAEKSPQQSPELLPGTFGHPRLRPRGFLPWGEGQEEEEEEQDQEQRLGTAAQQAAPEVGRVYRFSKVPLRLPRVSFLDVQAGPTGFHTGNWSILHAVCEIWIKNKKRSLKQHMKYTSISWVQFSWTNQ